jgi:hypothetical protein
MKGISATQSKDGPDAKFMHHCGFRGSGRMRGLTPRL